MTRFTQANLDKLEAIIRSFEEEGQRSTIIKHNIRDIAALSGFISIIRQAGVEIMGRTMHTMSLQDRKDFVEFLRAKRNGGTGK